MLKSETNHPGFLVIRDTSRAESCQMVAWPLVESMMRFSEHNRLNYGQVVYIEEKDMIITVGTRGTLGIFPKLRRLAIQSWDLYYQIYHLNWLEGETLHLFQLTVKPDMRYIWITGGLFISERGKVKPTDNTHIFDTITYKVTIGPNLPTRMVGHCAANLNESHAIFFNPFNETESVEVYLHHFNTGEWRKMAHLEKTWPCGKYLKLTQVSCQMVRHWFVIPFYDSRQEAPCTALLNTDSFEWKVLDEDNRIAPISGKLIVRNNGTKLLHLGGFISSEKAESDEPTNHVYELIDFSYWRKLSMNMASKIGGGRTFTPLLESSCRQNLFYHRVVTKEYVSALAEKRENFLESCQHFDKRYCYLNRPFQ